MNAIQNPIQGKTVANLVAEDYRYANVFKKYNIDFCCGGQKTLEQVCSEKNITLTDLKEALLSIQNNDASVYTPHFNDWPLDFLIDYIEKNHHQYVMNRLPLMLEYSQKVAKVHGHAYPENIAISRLIQQLAAEMINHMKKEEQILFPYVKELWKNDTKRISPPFGSAKNPIGVMEQEHENAGELMERLRHLSHNFQVPADACNTYQVLYSLLEEFETDLHMHVHLENNILFPKAIRLEESLMKRA